jgi:hypothetical protein
LMTRKRELKKESRTSLIPLDAACIILSNDFTEDSEDRVGG